LPRPRGTFRPKEPYQPVRCALFFGILNLLASLGASVPSVCFAIAKEGLFDHLLDMAFFIKDSDGRYVANNHSLAARHRLASKQEALGKRPCEIGSGDFGKIPSEQDGFVLRIGCPIVDHLEMQWELPARPV
jgi:hypothetical protein